MTSFIPVAPCVRRWTQSIHLAVLRAFSSLYWSIAAIASCRFVPITSEKICRPRCANRFRCACKKPTTNRMASGWKKNDDEMTTRWTRKELLGLREWTADEINFVLETTDAFKQVGTREIKKVPALRGKTLVNFFVEPSTRTRTSFELAAFRLSADVINISAVTSSLSKGETLKDTGKILEANHVDIIVLRHSSAGAPQFLAERLRSSVINAGDGAHEHPTQGLLDTYTIREKKKRLEGLNVVII